MRRAYLVFEGGGAKGALHTALLRAVASQKLSVSGYGGTSAGAIFAALAAVGYGHDDLIDLRIGKSDFSLTSPIFGDGFTVDGKVISRPTQLFRSWWLIFALRGLFAGKLGPVRILPVFLTLVALPYLPLLLEILVPGTVPFGGVARFWPLSTVIVCIAVALIFYVLRTAGIETLGRTRRALNILMSRKLGMPETQEVTFGDLQSRGILLTVVATNVSAGSMRLFSTENVADRQISVARAATASAAIPFLFRPVRIDSELYCDGGMVSNLPAWIFEAETVNDASAWIIASNLVDDVRPRKDRRLKATGLSYLGSVLRSAIFGADILSKRAVRNLYSMEVPAPLGLLEFDYHRFPERFAQAYLGATAVAVTQLKTYFAETEAHEKVFHAVRRLLCHGVSLAAPAGLRSALVRGDPSSVPGPTFHLWNCIGFEGSADRYLALSGKGSMVRGCLEAGRPQLLDLQKPEDEIAFYGLDRDGLIRDRTPRDRRWTVAVPLPVAHAAHSADSRLLGRYVSVAITFDCNDAIVPPSGSVLDSMAELIAREWHSGGSP